MVVVSIGGYLVLDFSRQPVTVYVASADLPAFCQVKQSDVRKSSISQSDLPPGTLRGRDALLGRYTLKQIKQDKPYTSAGMGPLLPTSALDKLSFVAIKSSTEVTLGGRLGRGDRIDVLLSATSKEFSSEKMKNVLVIDLTKDAVIIGVTASQAKTFMRLRGTARISVVRTVAYSRP